MALSASKDKNKAALGKRAKIDSAKRNMFIAIAAASVVLGVTLVGVVYLAKVIKFNNDVIGEKEEAIKGIEKVQENLKSLSAAVEGMSSNEYLESVARKRSSSCTNEKLESFQYSLSQLQIARTCTALRVIPDSMPGSYNEEATKGSMQQLLMWAKDVSGDYEIKTINTERSASIPARLSVASSTDSFEQAQQKLSVEPIGVSISVSGRSSDIMKALSSIESSVRPYDVDSFSISLAESGDTVIDLSATYVSYYSNNKSITINKKTLCADGESTECTKKNGSEIKSK